MDLKRGYEAYLMAKSNKIKPNNMTFSNLLSLTAGFGEQGIEGILCVCRCVCVCIDDQHFCTDIDITFSVISINTDSTITNNSMTPPSIVLSPLYISPLTYSLLTLTSLIQAAVSPPVAPKRSLMTSQPPLWSSVICGTQRCTP